MKKNATKCAALLLAACMALPLAACGKKGGDTQQLSGTVYVPEFVDVDLEGVDYINQGCADGQYIYFTADVRGEEKTETWTDPDTGEAEEYTYYDMRTGLFRVPLEGGGAAELENYAQPELPGGAEGDTYLYDLQPGEDGTLWVTERVTVYLYDLPEGFDEEANADEKWQYQTDYQETTIRRQLDSTGKELDRTDISEEVLREKLNTEYIGTTSFDKAGNVYVFLENKLAVLDKDLTPLFELEMQDMWGSIVQMPDGSAAMLASYEDRDTGNYGRKLLFIDRDNKSWGAEYEMSTSAYTCIPGGGDYLFYYQNGDSVYGWKAGATEGEKLFSWLSAGLNRSNISSFSILSDGRVAVLTQEWDSEGAKIGAAVLTPTDASTLPEKTTLTMATMWMPYNLRNEIMEFNQDSTSCRIEVIDYSEYNTGTDESAGLTKLNTEMIAGNVPDLLYTGSSLPVGRYAAKGILEDLWPYIEADAEIGGRESLMEHVLDAASTDGKLYQAFSTFSIQTVVGPAAVVGDRMSWTLADLQAALDAMPDGCTIFGVDDTKQGMLDQVLSMNMSRFVDWNTGKCSFDSDAFKALLAFCNSFPEEFEWTDDMEWESDMVRMLSGKQMLSRLYVSGFYYPQAYDQAFNGASAFIGYPKEDGSVGSCFSLGSGIAMSSACKDKDAAWSFVRQMFLPQANEENYDKNYEQYYFGGFPVNKSDFDKYVEGAMKESVWKDEDGEPVLDGDGEPEKIAKESYYISDDQRIEIYAATQDDVDRTMALYNSIDSLYGYDTSIYEIIEDQIGAYFAGDKDLDATASEIQNRVQLYMGENM